MAIAVVSDTDLWTGSASCSDIRAIYHRVFVYFQALILEQDKKNAIGSNLQRLRNRKDWTQADLAVHAQRRGWDIDRGTLAKIEAGLRRVYDTEIWHLSRILGCTPEDLYPSASVMMKDFIPPTKPKRKKTHAPKKTKRS